MYLSQQNLPEKLPWTWLRIPRYLLGATHDSQPFMEVSVFFKLLRSEGCWTWQVTKHIDDDGRTARNWQSWNWVSSGDLFLNGAFFTPSGSEAISSSYYTKATSILAHPARRVPLMTRDAGPLRCNRGVLCWHILSPRHFGLGPFCLELNHLLLTKLVPIL